METVSQTVNMYVYTQKTPLAKITRSYRGAPPPPPGSATVYESLPLKQK